LSIATVAHHTALTPKLKLQRTIVRLQCTIVELQRTIVGLQCAQAKFNGTLQYNKVHK
jgi:hypothetical protein